jgi:hypothetical protein
MKLFMLPGMEHCGNGDGFSQIDTLSPLMAWVDKGEAPAMLMADKVERGRGMAGPDGRGGRQQTAPYARANQPALASRPTYPFPQIAHPAGGDATKGSEFIAAPSDVEGPARQAWVGSELLAPKPQPFYVVVDGKVVPK